LEGGGASCTRTLPSPIFSKTPSTASVWKWTHRACLGAGDPREPLGGTRDLLGEDAIHRSDDIELGRRKSAELER
jgi:hypothetical protein